MYLPKSEFPNTKSPNDVNPESVSPKIEIPNVVCLKNIIPNLKPWKLNFRIKPWSQKSQIQKPEHKNSKKCSFEYGYWNVPLSKYKLSWKLEISNKQCFIGAAKPILKSHPQHDLFSALLGFQKKAIRYQNIFEVYFVTFFFFFLFYRVGIHKIWGNILNNRGYSLVRQGEGG